MFELSFNGNGVEAFADFGNPADEFDAVLSDDFVFGHGGRGEEAGAGLTEGFHEGAIGELASELGAEALGIEPVVEGAAQGGAWHGQEEGRILKRAGKVFTSGFCQVVGGEDGDVAFAELMLEGADLGAGADGGIGQEEVKAVKGEVGQQDVDIAFLAGELHVFGHFESGFEQAVGDDLGEGVGDADGEAQGTADGLTLEGVDQFTAEGEDLVGVAVDDVAGLGEDEATSDAVEEFLAERFFEGLQLGADGGLSQMQAFASLANAALARNCPEVEQVVIVQPLHEDRALRGSWKVKDGCRAC